MNTIEILEALEEIGEEADDEDECHTKADALLIVFLKGHDPVSRDIAEAWERAKERVGFWYS